MRKASRRGPAALLAAGVGAGLLLTGCGSATSTDTGASANVPTAFDMSGSLTLGTSQSRATRAAPRFKCGGSGGYADLQVGAQVVVYGPQGQTVAVGSVTDAISHVKDNTLDLSKEVGGPVTINADTCELVWSVSGVPGGLGMYSYEISHRGRLVLTEADAKYAQAATI